MQANRILILTNRVPYPLNDGGNMAMKAMIDGYAQNGWEVYLLSMNTSRHYVQQPDQNAIYHNLYAFETVDVNNNVKILPGLSNFFFSSLPNHVDRFNHRGFREKLREVLKIFAPSVVQVESPYLSAYLPDIKHYTGAYTVLRMHNIESQVWQRLADETHGYLKRYYLRNLAGRIKKYEQTVWNEYDLLLPITSIDNEVVKQSLGDIHTYVVPFGISLPVTQEKTVAEKWVGYHIGAMDWLPNREGINWFVNEVWPIVQKSAPGFEFYFAGRNMPVELYSMLKQGVHNEGEVPDAGEFISDKKILIVPIRSGGGIRVKILEAMSAGKIVISTAVGIQGIDAIPGRNCLLADTGEEFAKAIKWCLDNPKEAEIIAENARNLVYTRYNAGLLAKQLSEYLKQQI